MFFQFRSRTYSTWLYWLAVIFTFAMGTAVGDLTAMTFNLGYLTSAFMFLGALCLPLIAWRLGASPVATFWIAYVLTRPAGASFADYFGMPKDISGFGLGHGPVSAVLIVLVAAGIWFLKASGKDAQQPQAEVHFPEVFTAYEQLDVDCMLVSVMVEDAVRPVIAQAYAGLHSYWVGYSCAAQHSRSVQAGIVAPGGRWLARCPADGQPALAIADLDPDSPDEDIVIARRYARPWRRTARDGLYESRTARGDPRSIDRASF